MPNFIEALTSICHHATYLKLNVPKSGTDDDSGTKTLNLFSTPLPDPGISPIERMKKDGASSLADEELVSLLFSAGLTDKQSMELARELLKECGGLMGLSKTKARKLKSVPEIGEIRSSAILQCSRLLGALMPLASLSLYRVLPAWRECIALYLFPI